MSFGVIVNNRTAPASQGDAAATGTAIVCAQAAAGTSTSLTECRSIADLEAEYGPRAGLTVPVWDWVDTHIREGGNRVLVARYAADYGDALALLDKEDGPAQLNVPFVAPSPTLYSDMQAAAQANNLVAVRDVAANSTVAQMETVGADAPVGDDRGATFGPWVTVPAPAGTSGVGARTVPASAVISALCNRVDKAGNANRAAAGRDFPLQYVTGFELDPGDTDRAALFAAGVNCFKKVRGVLENYGFQTAIPQSDETPFWEFNCCRGRMYLQYRCEVRGEPYVFRTIDGRGLLEGAFASECEDECKQFYDADGLFGDTPQDAYKVNTGVSINSNSTIAQGEMHATVEARFSSQAKAVVIDLVSVPVTGVVS